MGCLWEKCHAEVLTPLTHASVEAIARDELRTALCVHAARKDKAPLSGLCEFFLRDGKELSHRWWAAKSRIPRAELGHYLRVLFFIADDVPP
jgi:hypothetical protein